MLSIESLLGWTAGGRAAEAHVDLTGDARSVARRLVADTLPRLDENRRLVMALYYYEELTVPEIAHALGLTASEVRSIQQSTVRMLEREVEARLRQGASALAPEKPAQ